jgi:type I restriction enzyme S subunit
MSAVLEAHEPSAKYLSALQPKLVQHFELLSTAPGGVVKLRELILALAVQGKLVPQDPRDEPASELLKKIRAEKDRLIAAGKLKREKPLAPIGDEEAPFDLPSAWTWARLGQVTKKITDGTHHSPANFPSGDFKYLSAKNIKSWGIDLSDVTYVPAAIHNEIYSRCDPVLGDILFIKDGATTGVLTINTLDEPFSLLSSVGVIKPSCGVSSKWLALLMRSPFFYRGMRAGMTGVAITRVTLSKLGVALVPVSPLAEQARIVTRVEELMRLCDALEAKGQLEDAQHAQLVQTLLGALTTSTSPDELADNWQRVATHFDVLLDRPEAIDALEETILQLAVRGLLVPQDPKDEPASELLRKIRAEKDRLIDKGTIRRDKPMASVAAEDVPFVLPRGWTWVRFDELIHPLKPIAYGVLVPGPDVETGVPFVRIADLSIDNPAPKPEKSIGHDIDKQFQRTRLEGGEILMGVVGSIGKLGVAPPTWAGANIARAICRIVPADRGLNDFVLFLLQTEFMQQSFVGDTRTLAQPTLNVGLIRQALTPVPPPAEQARIVARVDTLRRLCADLRQRLTARKTTQARLAEALINEVA